MNWYAVYIWLLFAIIVVLGFIRVNTQRKVANELQRMADYDRAVLNSQTSWRDAQIEDLKHERDKGRLLLQNMVDDPHNVETLEKVKRYLQSQ